MCGAHSQGRRRDGAEAGVADFSSRKKSVTGFGKTVGFQIDEGHLKII